MQLENGEVRLEGPGEILPIMRALGVNIGSLNCAPEDTITISREEGTRALGALTRQEKRRFDPDDVSVAASSVVDDLFVSMAAISRSLAV